MMKKKTRHNARRSTQDAVRKQKASNVSTSPQITDVSPQGYMTRWFSDYIFRKVSGDFYEVLREGIPIIDAAIRRLISLNGTIKIIGDNMPLVKELEDFCLYVPVNDMQKGIHAFLENSSNETFEQGFSISEFIATKDRKDIASLRVADSKNIIFRRNAESKAEPWYRYGVLTTSSYTLPGSVIEQIINASYGQTVSYGGVEETKLNLDNKLYFSINNENSNPYGVSIMRSLEFVAQILVTIQNSIKFSAERFGSPMYHVHRKGKFPGNADPVAEQKKLQTDFNTIISSKLKGQTADLVTVGGTDSEVAVKVIGGEGQILTFDIQLRHLLEQIVSKTNLPAWLLGVYWSTTERMATLEIEAALADAKIRQFAMLPEFIRLFSTFLKLRGRTWNSVTTSLDRAGDWGIIFETPNLRDILAIAQAKFLTAQADQMGAIAGTAKGTKAQRHIGTQAHRHKGTEARECSCGKTHYAVRGTQYVIKELQRPTPWPELDRVEDDYETTLKTRWQEMQEKVFLILKLSNAPQPPLKLRGGEGGVKDDLPGLEAFIFTEVQRAQIMQAYKDWLGAFDIADENSAIRWYYGQSYSLGLIQAANLIGKDRPILDIIKNKEIFDELCKNGFKLVKDNAELEIDKIQNLIESHVIAGSNPIQVARILENEFKGKDYDWERLARSEMSMAAERAKIDEWTEWDIKRVEFKPAPDACPICIAVAGDYDIGTCPIPVQDTHPRCRCGIRVSQSET